MTTLMQLSAKAPRVGVRPEVELLLCCARTRIDSETAERIKTLLQENIDWAYLIQTALRQGTMPLLYWNLNTTCPEAVPKVILSELRGHFLAKAQRSMFLTGQLLKLLNLFEVHGIPVIPFKGPVLAASVYGNLSLRQFCDLDILVRKRDFLKAKDLLISQRYQLQHERSWESDFLHAQSRVNLDLHQGITPKYFPDPIDFEQLWERLEPNTLAGTKVSNLMPEDLLLILCVQWGKDCCDQRSRLAQLCDVAELLRVHPQLDWGWLLKQARRLGCERMLLLDLCLVNELLGAALPEEILKRTQANPVVKSLASHVRSRLFCEAKDPPIGLKEKTFWSSWFYHERLHFRMTERLQDSVRYCLYRLSLVLKNKITPNKYDWAFLPLPPSLHLLYYLLRPIRLVRKYALVLLRRLSGT